MPNKNNNNPKGMKKTAGYQPLPEGYQPDPKSIEKGYQPKDIKVDVNNLKPPQGGTSASKPQSNSNK